MANTNQCDTCGDSDGLHSADCPEVKKTIEENKRKDENGWEHTKTFGIAGANRVVFTLKEGRPPAIPDRPFESSQKEIQG